MRMKPSDALFFLAVLGAAAVVAHADSKPTTLTPTRKVVQPRTDTGVVYPHPWANPAHPFHWVWLSGLWSDTPRHAGDDEPAPGGGDDVPGGGGIGGGDPHPCPDGNC